MTTYATLAADIPAFSNREDLTDKIPTFIRLAEAQMSRDIRHWRMENRAFITTSERYFPMPSDWLETIRLTIEGDYRALEFVSESQMANYRWRSGNAGGTPRFYRHSESAFEIFPTGDGENQFNLEYYQRVPALDPVTNTSNWLIVEAYDVYLYATMMHVWKYLMDDEQLQSTAMLYAAGMKQLNDTSNRSEFSGRGKRLRIQGLGGSNHGRYR